MYYEITPLLINSLNQERMKAGFIRSFDLSSPLRSVYSPFFLDHDLRVSLLLFCILFIGGFVSIDQ